MTAFSTFKTWLVNAVNFCSFCIVLSTAGHAIWSHYSYEQQQQQLGQQQQLEQQPQASFEEPVYHMHMASSQYASDLTADDPSSSRSGGAEATLSLASSRRLGMMKKKSGGKMDGGCIPLYPTPAPTMMKKKKKKKKGKKKNKRRLVDADADADAITNGEMEASPSSSSSSSSSRSEDDEDEDSTDSIDQEDDLFALQRARQLGMMMGKKKKKKKNSTSAPVRILYYLTSMHMHNNDNTYIVCFVLRAITHSLFSVVTPMCFVQSFFCSDMPSVSPTIPPSSIPSNLPSEIPSSTPSLGPLGIVQSVGCHFVSNTMGFPFCLYSHDPNANPNYMANDSCTWSFDRDVTLSVMAGDFDLAAGDFVDIATVGQFGGTTSPDGTTVPALEDIEFTSDGAAQSTGFIICVS